MNHFRVSGGFFLVCLNLLSVTQECWTGVNSRNLQILEGQGGFHHERTFFEPLFDIIHFFFQHGESLSKLLHKPLKEGERKGKEVSCIQANNAVESYALASQDGPLQR